ncbi:MAG: phosphoenolpyruvate carboxylase [Enterovibrio sp.]
MTDTHAELKSNINMLGVLLGETIKEAHGPELLAKVEEIRCLSKQAAAGSAADREALIELLQTLPSEQMLPVARAFSQFLNLANIAEQYHGSVAWDKGLLKNPLDTLLALLSEKNISQEQVLQTVNGLKIDLVLTAHPTEIARRTAIHNIVQIDKCLSQLSLSDLPQRQREKAHRRLEQLLAQSWHSDVIRKQRPTPIDEAKWGYAVIENSLWQAVPDYLRQLDQKLFDYCGYKLPLNNSPVQISSWIGGDRDGNPSVTAKVTREVLFLSKLKAASLYLVDIQELIDELSMTRCNDAVRELAGEEHEPYRAILKKVRSLLINTIHYLDRQNSSARSDKRAVLTHVDQLWGPLHACYVSLHECNMGMIADGLLLDILRRIRCFGIHLVKLDIRQEGPRHAQVLSEITLCLGMGDYSQWSEQDKLAFLVRELNSKRPLLPRDWIPTEASQEVINTCKIIAKQPQEAFGAYVISMAKTASDVLAVHLLLKEAGCPFKMEVCPLFETLDDLNNAKTVIEQLFSIDWYRGTIANQQMVMIGYSDSAKDAGVMAAGWAQYQAMESLISLCENSGVNLTLFHGRGGSIGRGGAPAHAALLSQPPRSLMAGLRVTEQGEMIRFKLGLPEIAVSSLNHYTSAILQANLLPPPEPKQEWRHLMDALSKESCRAYRDVVRNNPDFVPYFRAATPEPELGKLPLGSRPAKRNPNGGVESLRAIPWIFAWSQNRLLLPAWLGSGQAIESSIDKGNLAMLEEMCREWPFFSTRLGMLEMVFTKADPLIAKYYDEKLTDKSLWHLGEQLRTRLQRDIKTILMVENNEHLMAQDPWGAESIRLRNVYIEPLNMLQAELLHRTREQPEEEGLLTEALMITIAGIAAGLRNTG